MAENSYNATKMLKLTIKKIKAIENPAEHLLRTVLLKHGALRLQHEVRAARLRRSSVLAGQEEKNTRKRRKMVKPSKTTQ